LSKYTHLRTVSSFRGVDLRSSDVLRSNGFASDGTKNVIPSPQGGWMTRPGAKMLASTYGSLGLAKYETVNILGTKTTSVIGFGADSAANSAKPWKLVADTFTLTNSHASLAATVTHYYDEATSQFRFKIVRGGSTLIDQALGVGTEGGPYMLSTLRTAVNALTSFAMSAPTNGSTCPAAFMEVLAGETVAAASGTLTVTFWYWSAVNVEWTPSTDMSLINYAYEAGLDTFRNVSTVVLQNCLYISSGVKTAATVNGNTPVKKFHVMKYDGNVFTNLGMAQPYGATGATSNSTGTYTGVFGTIAYGSTVASGRTYQTQQVWVDKAGNEIEADLSPHEATSSGAAAVWKLDLTTAKCPVLRLRSRSSRQRCRDLAHANGRLRPHDASR
jgi:hypothetical protein